MVKIFSVEGNIGSGKSTIVKYLKDNLIIPGYSIVFLQEPVELWNTIKDLDGINIIQRYYADQKKYSFAFQMMAYISRLSQIKKVLAESSKNTIIITERCLHTDFNIFAKMLYRSGMISTIEYRIYKLWFDEFIDFSYITSFIYITTPPDICFERISLRSRKGEDLIPIEYLTECDRFHHIWLDPKERLELESTLNITTVNSIKDFILKFVRND
jgi:deoxyadenosine/deoxycytidine kinase